MRTWLTTPPPLPSRRAYGNAVSGFLLTMFDSPKWLVATMNIMAMVQLLVGEQVGRRSCVAGAGSGSR